MRRTENRRKGGETKWIYRLRNVHRFYGLDRRKIVKEVEHRRVLSESESHKFKTLKTDQHHHILAQFHNEQKHKREAYLSAETQNEETKI